MQRDNLVAWNGFFLEKKNLYSEWIKLWVNSNKCSWDLECAIYRQELTKRVETWYLKTCLSGTVILAARIWFPRHNSRSTGQTFKEANLWTQFCMAFSLGISSNAQTNSDQSEAFWLLFPLIGRPCWDGHLPQPYGSKKINFQPGIQSWNNSLRDRCRHPNARSKWNTGAMSKTSAAFPHMLSSLVPWSLPGISTFATQVWAEQPI